MSEDDFSDQERLVHEDEEVVCAEPKLTCIGFQPGMVSGLQQCQSSKANNLCIFDIDNKLKESETYDVGGTCTNSELDLSFYFTITNIYSERYILNLFVCHHTIGSFKIKISENDCLFNKKKEGKVKSRPTIIILPATLKSKAFTSSEVNENHYITSFYFSKADIQNIHTLYIPIEIDMNVNYIINDEILMWVKENHNRSVFQKKVNTDLTIVSSNGTKYDTHKLLLSTYSTVLKEKIKENKINSITLDIDDDEMSLLLELIYKHTIHDIENKYWHKILNLAEKLDIDSLRELVQIPMSQQISVDNAVNIAILSEKYRLIDIQRKIIDFIKKTPEVLDTESWNNLNDIELTKKLLKGICISSNNNQKATKATKIKNC